MYTRTTVCIRTLIPHKQNLLIKLLLYVTAPHSISGDGVSGGGRAGSRVLCLDGGGIRGLIELEVLSQVEPVLNAWFNNYCVSRFLRTLRIQ